VAVRSRVSQRISACTRRRCQGDSGARLDLPSRQEREEIRALRRERDPQIGQRIFAIERGADQTR
jgi:hypothetical protein